MKKGINAANLTQRSNNMASSVQRTLTQNLQCPICLNTFNQPKLLVCSHTFCTGCLKLLFKFQTNSKSVLCPICQRTTTVPEGDIGSLQTNLPMKSLVEDFKNQSQMCSICKTYPKPAAVTYCQECEDYMCVDCHKTHDKWDRFTGHQVVKVEDILSGKVMMKQRRKCKKHPSEVEECFCDNCKKYVCFRCGMMEHTKAGHEILEGVEHEENQRMETQKMIDSANSMTAKLDEYNEYIDAQKVTLQEALKGMTDSIKKAYEDSVKQVRAKQDQLVSECESRVESLDRELAEMKDAGILQMVKIENITELVVNGVKAPLEGESLAAHDTLCKDLEAILGDTDVDYDKATCLTQKGERITFLRVRNCNSKEPLLGKIVAA